MAAQTCRYTVGGLSIGAYTPAPAQSPSGEARRDKETTKQNAAVEDRSSTVSIGPSRPAMTDVDSMRHSWRDNPKATQIPASQTDVAKKQDGEATPQERKG